MSQQQQLLLQTNVPRSDEIVPLSATDAAGGTAAVPVQPSAPSGAPAEATGNKSRRKQAAPVKRAPKKAAGGEQQQQQQQQQQSAGQSLQTQQTLKTTAGDLGKTQGEDKLGDQDGGAATKAAPAADCRDYGEEEKYDGRQQQQSSIESKSKGIYKPAQSHPILGRQSSLINTAASEGSRQQGVHANGRAVVSGSIVGALRPFTATLQKQFKWGRRFK